MSTLTAEQQAAIAARIAGIKRAKCRSCGSEMIGIETTGELPALRALLTEAREALRELVDLCDDVPVFQLDSGKSSVKAVRMAGKFVGALDEAKAVLAKGDAP